MPPFRRPRALAAAALAALLALVACSDDDSTGPGEMSDAEIVAVVMAANAGEVTTSQPALTRAASQSVRGFAQMMIDAHTSADQLLQGVGIAPRENGTSRQLTQTAAQTTQALGQLTGAAFDRAYLDAQLSMHTATLGLLVNELIPEAQSASLRATLQNLQDAVAAHLVQAQQLRNALG